MGELASNDRVKACIKFRGRPGFDLAISRIVQIDEKIREPAEQWMMAEQLVKPAVSELEFSRYRYYTDLPGNGLAWGTIKKHI